MCFVDIFCYKMGLNDVLQWAKQQRKASGITHERCANFRHRKKNRNRANLKLRHALRARGVKIACIAGGIRGHKEGSLKYRLPKN